MTTRRKFLTGIGAGAAALTLPTQMFAGNWGINAVSQGLRPNSDDDQSKQFQEILEKAAISRQPVFLEPGIYQVSDLNFPAHVVLNGVPGSTVLRYSGGKHFLLSENADQLSVNGVDFDGGLLPIEEYSDAALRINSAAHVDIRNCRFSNSAACGLEVTGSTGSIASNRIESIVGPAGFLGYNNTGLSIRDNVVEDCANGGILVHRWQRGEDNTIIANNRVRRIAAIYGGTGQWGNGINTYLADGVIVSDNHVSDCAFSAVRSNSCSNIQISDNTCLRAGETSVYSEFAFEGAKITGNVVDGGITGISISNFNEGGRLSVCANNIVRNIHDNVPYEDNEHVSAIGIAVEADTVVTGNVIEKCKNFGMLLGWGHYLRNVSVNANVVRAARMGMYVSVVEGIGAVNIANNIFSKVPEGGIIGHRWKDAVTNDLAISGADRFSALMVSGNSVS